MSVSEDRSVSRGRDVYQSSGRGGAGNIRQASASREPRPQDGPDDFSTSRGREPVSAFSKMFSTGRGGAGNIRSPSRDVQDANSTNGTVDPAIAEEEVIRVHVVAAQDIPYSSGRGGAGNIGQPHSRSRSRGPGVTASPLANVHSTGRGGVGNIVSGAADGYEAELKDEEERKSSALRAGDGGIHSTGRGGSANMTAVHGPPPEHPVHAHGEYESTGRGGVGNIARDQSASRS